MGRWQRYWFAEGGRVTLALLRIALAIGVMLTLVRLRGTWPANAPGAPGHHEVYRPVGVWMLLGHSAPADGLLEVLWKLAWLGAIAMLVGLGTRIAIAVTFVAGMALAAVSYGGTQTWSHQYNVVWIAMFAFQGARAGDVLSVDWWIRRWRGLPPIDVPRGYQWSIRLVQLAVALMFFSGMFHKIIHGHFTLRWALSDNLRHHLLVRYDLAGVERPAIVDWIIDDVWRYRLAALLNLVTQTAPIAAVFLMKRPVLRAAAGMFFVIETLALGVVMELWNLHWLPLVAVFVDWEAAIALVRRKPFVPAQAPKDWRVPVGPRIFVIAFVVYDAITALVPAIDQRLNTYPFSGFPMFATIRARTPYSDHLPYSVSGGHFEVLADHPLDDTAFQWIDYTYRTTIDVHDPDELHKRLAAILEDVKRRAGDPAIHGLRLHLAIFEAPAYPAPARFERHLIAIQGEVHDDGSFRSALGHVKQDAGKLHVIAKPQGIDLAGADLVYYRDDLLAPIDVGAGRDTVDGVEGDPVYFVEVAGGTPWLVAKRHGWRWQ